jgi:hypothetical protein
MGTEIKRSKCAVCGRPMETDVLEDGTSRGCGACAATAQRRAGTVLRHWTTNDSAFMGKASTRPTEAGDWGLAAGRQRNLVAAKLSSLSGGVGAL